MEVISVLRSVLPTQAHTRATPHRPAQSQEQQRGWAKASGRKGLPPSVKFSPLGRARGLVQWTLRKGLHLTPSCLCHMLPVTPAWGGGEWLSMLSQEATVPSSAIQNWLCPHLFPAAVLGRRLFLQQIK